MTHEAVFSKPGFVVIGHRGCAGHQPENTLAGFQRAIDLGVDAVEFDVHGVEDRLIVIHDDTLDRTTSGHGKLQLLGLKKLRALDAGNQQQIPYIEEVLEIIPETVGINIELKGLHTAKLVDEILRTRNTPSSGVLVSSFHDQELRRFRELNEEIPVAILSRKYNHKLVQLGTEIQATAINLGVRQLHQVDVDAVQENDFACLVYTVNDVHRVRQLKSWGVSGVFTDVPALINQTTISN